jgi:hypothetical protein
MGTGSWSLSTDKLASKFEEGPVHVKAKRIPGLLFGVPQSGWAQQPNWSRSAYSLFIWGARKKQSLPSGKGTATESGSKHSLALTLLLSVQHIPPLTISCTLVAVCRSNSRLRFSLTKWCFPCRSTLNVVLLIHVDSQ